MSYLEYIKNDNRTMKELDIFFESNYPNYIFTGDFWGETTGINIHLERYLISYIHIKKPMTIIEYGSGLSTFIMSTVLEDLNYGGKLISFEDDEKWYKQNKDLGLYDKSEVHLVPILTGVREAIWKNNSGTNYGWFDHNFSDIDSVDFIFDDGPNMERYDITYIDNWYMAANHFKKPFDLIIDGRSGAQARCKYLYPDNFKSGRLGILETHSNKLFGIGTQIGGIE